MIIEVHHLDSQEKKRFVIDKSQCIIGRSKNADVTIGREELSRTHFQLEYDGKNFFITDLNSTNGVVVDGERLPAGERILYRPVFPIEIGDKISITVAPEATTSIRVPQSGPRNLNLDLPSGPSPFSEETITKVASSRHRSQPRSRETKASTPAPQEGRKMLPTILTVLGILSGVYFYYEEQKKVLGPSEHLENTPPPKITGKTLPPEEALTQIDYKSLMSRNECETYAPLCSTIELTRSQEAVVFSEQKLIVFVNLGEFVMKNEAQSFKDLPEAEKKEYYLASIGVRPELIQLATKLKATHLVVVGFVSIEGLVVTNSLLSVNYPKFSKAEAGFHKGIFSNVFFGGIFRYYRDSVRPDVKFQTF